MDDTTGAPPPPYGPGPGAAPPPPPGFAPVRPALRRSRTDRKVFGVAGGLAEYFGIDPLLVRVLFVVTALSGAGIGIFLYLACAVLVPAEPAAPGPAGAAGSQSKSVPPGEAFVDRHGKVLGIIAGIFAVTAILGGGGPFGWGHDNGFWGIIWLALLVTVIVLVSKEVESRRDGGGRAPTASPTATTVFPPAPPGSPAPQTPPTPPTAFAASSGPGPGATAQAPSQDWTGRIEQWSEQYDPPLPPRPAEPASGLGVLTLGAALLAVGTLVGLDRADVVDVSTLVMLAVALTVVGAGLLVGAFVGRARWLIWIGVLLAIATGVASLDLPGDGQIGETVWRPAETEVAQEYTWGVGDAQLDLTRLTSALEHDVDVELGVGSLTILLPESATVDANAHVGIGTIRGLGDMVDGVDRDASAVLPGEPAEPAGAQIDIDASLGVGEVKFIRVSP